MTVNEIIENENIRSDRYAMAAISFIFNAFGDPIRSKEYWPWGKNVQCEWQKTNGTNIDILYAIRLLDRALIKYNEEDTNTNTDINKINSIGKAMDEFAKDIKQLKKRINKLKINTKNIISATDELKKVNDDAINTLNNINVNTNN